MDNTEITARIRGMGFMAGVLRQQASDPLCSECISYALTLGRAREALGELGEILKDRDVPEGYKELMEGSAALIKATHAPKSPVKQRKEGRCKLPDKACFVKKSARIFLFHMKDD